MLGQLGVTTPSPHSAAAIFRLMCSPTRQYRSISVVLTAWYACCRTATIIAATSEKSGLVVGNSFMFSVLPEMARSGWRDILPNCRSAWPASTSGSDLSRPRPSLRRWTLAAAGIAVAQLASCAPPVDRATSFAPYLSTTLDGVPVARYVSLRTGLLSVCGAGFERAGRDRVNFRLEPSGAYGLATAVADDGYFVTAAHCADGKLTILFTADHDLWAGTPRVVVRGVPGRTDLAVLRIDHRLPFDVPCDTGADITVGAPVIGVGAGLEDVPPRQTECLGGHVTAVGPWSTGAVVVRRVDTDLPARPGDSGGGVLTLDGRLIAIIVGGNAASRRCDAIRPDPAWLADVIARDRRAHPAGDPGGRWAAHRVAATAPATGAD